MLRTALFTVRVVKCVGYTNYTVVQKNVKTSDGLYLTVMLSNPDRFQ